MLEEAVELIGPPTLGVVKQWNYRPRPRRGQVVEILPHPTPSSFVVRQWNYSSPFSPSRSQTVELCDTGPITHLIQAPSPT